MVFSRRGKGKCNGGDVLVEERDSSVDLSPPRERRRRRKNRRGGTTAGGQGEAGVSSRGRVRKKRRCHGGDGREGECSTPEHSRSVLYVSIARLPCAISLTPSGCLLVHKKDLMLLTYPV